MTFIFDTGSAWTWIPSEDCPDDQCANNHYNYKKSKGYRKTYQVEKIVYGIGEINGFVVNDDISISNSIAYMATDVNFLSIFSAKHLSSLKSDGLLGLSPKSQFDENHLLVNELKKDGVIEKAIFSVYLTDLSGQSYMEFGSYDQAIVSESNGGIFWM